MGDTLSDSLPHFPGMLSELMNHQGESETLLEDFVPDSSQMRCGINEETRLLPT